MRFLAGVFLLIAAALLGCESVATVKSKEEYAFLQGLEYERRGTRLGEGEVVERDGYLAAGFPGDGHDENVWVLLNARYPPYFKQMPGRPFIVSHQALEAVRRTPGVSKVVLVALEARVSSGRPTR